MTEALDKAAANRLTALLMAREAMRPARTLLQEMNENKTLHERLTTLMVLAGVYLTLIGKANGKARMEAVFALLELKVMSPEARADTRRVGRACRLLRHLLMVGCLRRGEVPGMPGGGRYHSTPAG